MAQQTLMRDFHFHDIGFFSLIGNQKPRLDQPLGLIETALLAVNWREQDEQGGSIITRVFSRVADELLDCGKSPAFVEEMYSGQGRTA